MEKVQLLKDIQQIADRIKNNPTNESLLVADAALIHEKAILLKHLPAQDNIASPPIIAPLAASVKKEETKQAEKPIQQVDLFSNASVVQEEKRSDKPASVQTDKTTAPTSASSSSGKKAPELKSLIGINDKFQFINELFDGNMKEYNLALDRINTFSAQQEANQYISQLKEAYKWKEDNEAAGNFQGLVKKLFV